SGGTPIYASCRRCLRGRARLDGEAASAAAGRLGVGVADSELRAVQAFNVVDRRAHQVLQAQRVHQQDDAVGVDGQVVLALLFVELEAVLAARAAATLDVHAQLQRRVAFLGDQLADLGGRGGGEVERSLQRLVAGGGAVGNVGF